MIEFIKQVTFKDWNGTVLKTYNVGDRIPFTAKVDAGYFVTSMGGIWFDEAIEVAPMVERQTRRP